MPIISVLPWRFSTIFIMIVFFIQNYVLCDIFFVIIVLNVFYNYHYLLFKKNLISKVVMTAMMVLVLQNWRIFLWNMPNQGRVNVEVVHHLLQKWVICLFVIVLDPFQHNWDYMIDCWNKNRPRANDILKFLTKDVIC